jgi:hypothetical protein
MLKTQMRELSEVPQRFWQRCQLVLLKTQIRELSEVPGHHPQATQVGHINVQTPNRVVKASHRHLTHAEFLATCHQP